MNKISMLFVLFFVVFGFAQNANQLKFIEKNVRPKPEVLMRNERNLVDTNQSAQQLVEIFKENLPYTIVALEKTFPGATYAFLGRDVDLIADAIDAYYISIGQTGRVVHIPFSTPSMQGATTQSVVGFLEGLGLDTRPQAHRGGEFVIVDFTSFRNGGGQYVSQSAFIFNRVVDYFRDRSFSAAEIMKRINVATLNPNLRNSYDVMAKYNNSPRRFKAKQVEDLIANGIISQIALVANPKGRALAYSNPWNNSYGPIQYDLNGRYFTEPASVFNVAQKQPVFWEIVAMINLVRSQSFKRTVTRLANDYNIDIKAIGRKAASCKKVSGY